MLFAIVCGLALASQAAIVGDRVWIDHNWDGLQSGGSETGIPGIIVRLYDVATNQLSATTTDPSGLYRFTNLTAGIYRVGFVRPDGYRFATANVGTNDVIDSDPREDIGLSPAVTVASTETNLSVDAGLQLITPCINLIKRAQPAADGAVLFVTSGTVVAYTYMVTNCGNTHLEGVTVIDDRLGAIGSIAYPALLAPGASVTFTNYAAVTSSVTNVAETCGNAVDSKGLQWSSNTVTVCATNNAVVIVANPSAAIQKRLASPVGRPAAVGENFAFSILVTNTGDIRLDTVPLTDRYDTGKLTFVSAVPSPSTGVPGTLTWTNLGALGVGGFHSVSVLFAAASSGTQTNTAITAPTVTNGLPVTPGTSSVPHEAIAPSVGITKTLLSPTGRPARVGETFTFRIVVTNTGTVRLDTVPLVDTYSVTKLSYVTSIPAPSATSPGTLTWGDLGSLPVGGVHVVTSLFLAVASGVATNVVVTSPTLTNGVPVTPATSSVPHTATQSGFTLVKTLASPTNRAARVGEQVVFNVAISNSGEVALGTVPLIDTFDTNLLTVVSQTRPANATNLITGTLTWTNLGPLSVGANTGVVVRFTARRSGAGTNVVTCSPSTTNGVPVSPQTSSAPHVASAPGYTITKTLLTANACAIYVGQQVSFAVTVANTGDVPLITLPVDDWFDATSLQFATSTPPADVVGAGTASWTNLGPLAAGSSTTVLASFTALTGTGVMRTNVAVAAPETPAGQPGVTRLTNAATYAISSISIGNTVWIDLNGNAVIDENLVTNGLNSVRLDLLRISGGVTSFLASTWTTNSGGRMGYYSFTNLPYGVYAVRLDMLTVPLILTKKTTHLRAPPTTIVDPSSPTFPCGGNVTNVFFGFQPAKVTGVSLTDLRAMYSGSAVEISWAAYDLPADSTFRIYRSDTADRAQALMIAEIQTGSASLSSQEYCLANDTALQAGATYYYWVEVVGLGEAPPLLGPVACAIPALELPATVQFPVVAGGALFRVDFTALLGFGLPVNQIAHTRLHVLLDDREVPRLVSASGEVMQPGDFLIFYAPERPFTYQLRIEVTDADAREMNWSFVRPLRGAGALQSVLAEERGVTYFATDPLAIRSLVSGLKSPYLWALDITDPEAPRILYGYSLISAAVSGEYGLYMSATAGVTNRCVIVEEHAFQGTGVSSATVVE